MSSDRIDLDTLRSGARLAGFAWTDAELDEIRTQVEATLRLLRVLESVDLASTEPTTSFRAV